MLKSLCLLSYKPHGFAVLASGLWVAPGDSEEVAAALSQALRNCIERLIHLLSLLCFLFSFWVMNRHMVLFLCLILYGSSVTSFSFFIFLRFFIFLF